jgi:hypothetical protein
MTSITKPVIVTIVIYIQKTCLGFGGIETDLHKDSIRINTDHEEK